VPGAAFSSYSKGVSIRRRRDKRCKAAYRPWSAIGSALLTSCAGARPRGLDWAGLKDGRLCLDLNRATADAVLHSVAGQVCAAIAVHLSIAIEVAAGAA